MKTPKQPKPAIKKEKRWALKDLTCAELAEHTTMAIPADYARNPSNEALRELYGNAQRLRLLRLCGDLCASYHKAWTRTARQLEATPHIQLTCTGGRPKKDTMPRFSASLKRLGAMNGVVIHQMESRAFIQHITPKDPDTLSHPQNGEAMEEVDLFTISPH